MNQFSAIMSGFSIVSAVILLLAYLFFLADMQKTRAGKFACCAVLLGLACVQYAHFIYFAHSVDVLEHRVYGVLLAYLPVAFFAFSREVLFYDSGVQPIDVLHLTPIVLAGILPLAVVPPLAFLVGTGYTFHFAHKIMRVRRHTGRFRFEVFFFGLFFLMAVVALILGLALPLLNHAVYYHAYANAIAMAMALVVAALLVFPELLSDITLITETTYANSTLESVDVDGKLLHLERLMIEDRHYENETLSLSNLADLLDLSSHQLSELVNSQYGYGFPKFVREHRIRAAKTLLIAEPEASVLTVSLATGFKSQSSFYTAFKEITGVSPGNFRKQQS